MVEKKDPNDKVKLAGKEVAGDVLEAVDVKGARLATAGQVEEVVQSNPNQSSGSLQTDKSKQTFEIVKKKNGKEEVLDSRHVREQQKERAQITLDQLQQLGRSGNGFAADLVRQYGEAKTDKERARILVNAERICGHEKLEEVKAPEVKPRKADTQGLKAIYEDESIPKDRRELAKIFQEIRASSKALGEDVSQLEADAEEMLAPELTAVAEPELIQGSFTALKTGDHSYQLNIGLEERVARQKDVVERIAELPLDQQARVIGGGLCTFFQSMGDQSVDINYAVIRGAGAGVMSLGEEFVGFVKTAADVVQFAWELETGSPEGYRKAQAAKEAIGKILTGGVQLWSVTEAYLGEIGATGDYAKPMRDIQWLADQMNERWNKLTPAQKAGMAAKLEVQILGNVLLPIGAAKLAKCEKVTTFMEVLANAASKTGGGAKEKVGKWITSFMDDLFADVAVTPDGQRIRVPRRNDLNEPMQMSHADDGLSAGSRPHDGHRSGGSEPVDSSPDSGRNPQQNDGRPRIADEVEPEVNRVGDRNRPPLEPAERARLVAHIQELCENLEPGLKDFLVKRDVKIKICDFISDVKPNQVNGHRAMGVYDWGSNTIYVPMRVMHGGVPITNPDLAFAIRHEIGHAFNFKALENPSKYYAKPFRLSDKLSGFIKKFDDEFSKLSAGDLRTMGFENKTAEDLAFARDEVFADLYAHAGNVPSTSARSLLIRNRFQNCLQYMRKNIRG